MHQVTLWIAGAIASGLVGLVLAVALDEPLRGILSVALGRRAKINPLVGTWRACFTMADDPESYTEIIELKKKFGRVEGRIVPHPDNHPGLRLIEDKKPVRVEGDLSTSDVFSGRWFHPRETSRYQGTFQLLLNPNGNSLTGKWLGYSASRTEIITGDWNWVRTT